MRSSLLRLVVGLALVVGVVVGFVPSAQAVEAPGNLCFWTHSTSALAINVRWDSGGTQYNDPVGVNQIEGEPGCEATALTVSGNIGSEPVGFYTAASYCTNYKISTNGGFSWSLTYTVNNRLGTSAKWLNTYPSGFANNWLMQAATWNC